MEKFIDFIFDILYTIGIFLLGIVAKKIWIHILRIYHTIFPRKEVLSDTEFIIKLGHSPNRYNPDHITTTYNGKCQIIPIPDNKIEDLVSDFFPYNDKVELYTDALKSFVVSNYHQVDYDSLIAIIAEQTADDFIAKKRLSGTANFNKKKFGIYRINTSRTSDNENPIIMIELFETDYFTFRVTAKLYQYLYKIDSEPFTRIKSISDLTGYSPFLCSIGTGGLIYSRETIDTEIFLGKRSNNINAGSLYHITFNEGFNTDDKNHIDQTYCTTECLKRGICEELNLNNIQQEKYLSNALISHALLVNDGYRFETSLYGCMEIFFNDKFTKEFFLQAVSNDAQDGDLEFETIKIIKLSDINNFIQQHSLTPECKYMINFLRREHRIK